jgi:parallel beta-helix repeat protein
MFVRLIALIGQRPVQHIVFSVAVLVLLAKGGTPQALAQASATYRVTADDKGQTTIVVTGQGATVTLQTMQAGLGAATELLEDHGDGVWQLNANLLIEKGVTLTLRGDAGVRELRLRSESSTTAATPGSYDYSSFVYLRTDNGVISIDGVRIHSWDRQANQVDTEIANGRSYLLAKYDARMDIANAELSYLGSADGESYGVAWRDTNDPARPDELRTRVSGEVINSTFHRNYYGVYTFQASDMIFRGNTFSENIGYGFDPHDYSHHFVVEDNQAFANGNHGFIISRGCNNFVFRRNKSYGNTNVDLEKFAHGFMIDPGSPQSNVQVPSTANLFEQNHAYDNEGYGLRILGSSDNVIKQNIFERNEQGITVEGASANNVLLGNTITANRIHGIFVRSGTDATTIRGNSVANNAVNGLYIKSNGTTVDTNDIHGNGGDGIHILPESVPAAFSDLLRPGVERDTAQLAAELVGTVVVAQTLTNNRISSNTVANNGKHGITLKGSLEGIVEGNIVTQNTEHGVYLASGARANQLIDNHITANGGDGIRANGADVLHNQWRTNLVFANGTGDIRLTGGANSKIQPPQIVAFDGTTVRGTATAGATVELFADKGQERRGFVGRTVAAVDGSFSLTIAQGMQNITATATDPAGNSSAFAQSRGWTQLYLPLVRMQN